MESRDEPHHGTLPPRLGRLARELAALSAEERQQVVAAAQEVAQSAPPQDEATRRRARWTRFRALAGVVSIGGNAVEDCERLYDG